MIEDGHPSVGRSVVYPAPGITRAQWRRVLIRSRRTRGRCKAFVAAVAAQVRHSFALESHDLEEHLMTIQRVGEPLPL